MKSITREQAITFSSMTVPSIDAESRAARSNSTQVDEEANAEVAPSSSAAGSSGASSQAAVPAAVPRYFIEEFGNIAFPKRIGKPLGERAPVGFKLVF